MFSMSYTGFSTLSSSPRPLAIFPGMTDHESRWSVLRFFCAEMRRRDDPVAHVQLGRGDSLVSPKSRFEREVQDAAGQQGSLPRVGRGAGLEHLFDISHQAGEVSV